MDSSVNSIAFKTSLKPLTDSTCARFGGALSKVLYTPADKGDGYATATDGRVMAVVDAPQAGLADKEHYIPAALAMMGNVSVNGEWRHVKPGRAAKTTVAPINDEGRYPDTGYCLPDCVDCVQIELDANALADLQAALNTDSKCLRLLLPRAGDKGKITGSVCVIGEHGIGVIQPMQSEREGRAIASCAEFNRKAAGYRAARTRHAAQGTSLTHRVVGA